MTLEQHSYRTLLVSSNEKFIKEIGSLLPAGSYRRDCAKSGSEARRRLLENAYDFIIVNAPLSDEAGTRLCIDAGQNSSAVALIFVAAEVYDETYAKAAPRGVFLLRKPISGSAVSQALSLLISARERLRIAEKKAGKAESKLSEIRIVNKAKWFLIDSEGMSEADAHSYIEKSAMDAAISKKQAAQIIIDRYQ